MYTCTGKSYDPGSDVCRVPSLPCILSVEIDVDVVVVSDGSRNFFHWECTDSVLY